MLIRLDPLAESATLLRRLWVLLGSTLLTAAYCVRVLYLTAVGQLDRSKVDGFTRTWSKGLLKMVRMDLKVSGQAPDFNDGRRYIVLCTHSSHYDIPASFVALPGSIRMLAKQELFRIPLFGRAMRAAEFPSIDRHNRQRAFEDLRKARSMMESGIVLWAAPEGTRSRDGHLLPFKKGCFRLALDTGAVIVPVAIRGIHHVLPAHSLRMNLGLPVELKIGAPIDAGQFTTEQLEVLMLQVREKMQALLEG
jgi:1-acyl-sn-glycerol-3-phosphate acyltransferase